MKTSELTGRALDYAVALALGHELECRDVNFGLETQKRWTMLVEGMHCFIPNYACDITAAWPIIVEHRIDLFSVRNGNGWAAQSDIRVFTGYGTDPIGAAMRCFVASKLGDKIEMPKEMK